MNDMMLQSRKENTEHRDAIMAYVESEISTIRTIFNDQYGEDQADFKEIKNGIKELNSDFKELKDGLTDLKNNFAELKVEQKEMKGDMKDMKGDIKSIKKSLADNVLPRLQKVEELALN